MPPVHENICQRTQNHRGNHYSKTVALFRHPPNRPKITTTNNQYLGILLVVFERRLREKLVTFTASLVNVVASWSSSTFQLLTISSTVMFLCVCVRSLSPKPTRIKPKRANVPAMRKHALLTLQYQPLTAGTRHHRLGLKNRNVDVTHRTW